MSGFFKSKTSGVLEMLAIMLLAVAVSTPAAHASNPVSPCSKGCGAVTRRCIANGRIFSCNPTPVDAPAEDTDADAAATPHPQCSSHTCSATGTCCNNWTVCDCSEGEDHFSYTCKKTSSKSTRRSLLQQGVMILTPEPPTFVEC